MARLGATRVRGRGKEETWEAWMQQKQKRSLVFEAALAAVNTGWSWVGWRQTPEEGNLQR